MAKTKEVREGNRPGLRKNRTPRLLFAIEDSAPKSKPTSKKSTVPKAKANTSEPRAKAANVGRVEKKKTPATKNKRTPTIADKVKGGVEKIVGAIEGKPAKKGAGTKKIKGTDGKGSTRVKKSQRSVT